MKAHLTHRTTCRLCESPRVEKVVELKPIPLSENYSTDATAGRSAERYPVDVYMCADCGHVQQLDVVDSRSLWESYTYFSGDAKGMPEHFRSVAADIIREYSPRPGGLVVDIGSNDGSLLRPFKEAGFRVLGIDPAVKIAEQATREGIETLPELASLPLARRIRSERGPAEVVCMFNAFAHADNLGEVADCIRTLMADDGIFVFEAQYLLDMIDRVLIATVFHEHMSHHSVGSLVPFFQRHGLELIDVVRVPVQHGSLVGTVQLRGRSRPVRPSVGNLLQLEKVRRLGEVQTLRAFADTVLSLRQRASGAVRGWRSQGASVAGFGAARSAATLIAQLGLEGCIEFIVDDHPQKVGRFTSGDGIPILPTAELLKRMPRYTLILAWVHGEKIIESNRRYLEAGGRFVVLCPEFRVVGRDGVELSG